MKCIGCALEKRKIKSKGDILLTKYFRCIQDYEIPIPGFVILSTRRHIKSIVDFNQKESKEFIKLLSKIRKVMRSILKIKYVYLIQEEDSKHHFHMWLFPRYKWMNKFGGGIESVITIMNYAKRNLKGKKNLEKVESYVEKLREKLR